MSKKKFEEPRVRIPQDVLGYMLDALLDINGQGALLDYPGWIARCELDQKVEIAIAEFKRRCPHLAKRMAKELYGYPAYKTPKK